MTRPTLTPHWLRGLLLAGALLAGCTYVTIQNQSDTHARVRLKLPDRRGPIMVRVPANGESTKVTSTGGSYTVAIVPFEEYEAALKLKKDQLAARLFDPNTPISPGDAKAIGQEIFRLNQEIEKLFDNLPDCTSKVEANSTALVQVSRGAGDQWAPPVCNPGISQESSSSP